MNSELNIGGIFTKGHKNPNQKQQQKNKSWQLETVCRLKHHQLHASVISDSFYLEHCFNLLVIHKKRKKKFLKKYKKDMEEEKHFSTKTEYYFSVVSSKQAGQ